MGTRPTISLPSDVIERCRHHAARIVADYDAGFNAASRAVSTHGMERNVEWQAHGKMAECAFALWLGVSLDGLNWSRRPDTGADISFYGFLLDVKATTARGRYLIWPIGKRHIFESKRFDALVLVKGDIPIFEIVGFIEKRAFADRHRVWDGDHGLQPGTWYMAEDELVPPRWIKPYAGIA